MFFRIIIVLIKVLVVIFFTTNLIAQDNNKQDTYLESKYYNKDSNYKGNISGKVRSSLNKKNLEFATITLKRLNTNEIIEGTITDSKGKFIFKNISVGKYKIIFSYIGFKEKEVNIETSKKKPDFRLNKILLEQDSELLSEITIEEEKAIYESKIDKIVYNAENDLNESENDATDVLRKAPLLSVDLEGNVSLRGSKNIRFLVNGKASSFFTSDIATALQMIPANEIKSVEVITSPGAKYDGEGDAGIVNIITKKTIIDGYNATINAMAGTKSVRSNLDMKLGKGRFGFSARAGTFGSWPGRIGTHMYERVDWENKDSYGNPINPNILKQEGITENYFQGYRGSVNAFYDINAYNSFNSSFRFGGRTKPNNINDSIQYNHGLYDSLSYSGNYISEKTDRTLNMEWTTDYTKKFSDNEERELIIALQLGGDINNGNTYIVEENNILFNQNDEKVIEETFQIDYTHPFGNSNNNIRNTKNINQRGRRTKRDGKKKSSSTNKIDIGIKIINRDREMVYSNQENNIYTLSEEFIYNQLVTASYISSQILLPYGLGLKGGLRYEQTKSSGEWNNNSINPFENNYSNILPSAVISKSFSPMRSIKFSYNKRIRRPSVKQINTNENKQDNRNLTTGNPNLKPTITEQYEFAINSFGRILQGSCQLYYKHSSNVIESFLDTIINEVSISRYKNIGESKQLGTNLFGSINLKKLSLRASFDIYNYSGKDASLGYSEWTKPVLLYSYFVGGSYNITNYWKAETFGFFRSPNQTIQGSNTSWSMMSIGIKKIFKNKRGSIGLRIIEPFNKNKEFISDLDGEFFTQTNTSIMPFRSFGISFKYTIGKLNFREKNSKTKINNDDIIEENNSSEY